MTRPAALDGRSEGAPIVSVRDLSVWFSLRRTFVDAVLRGGAGRSLRAVDGVSLDIRPGEILGLAGESGCGKSTLALTLLGLHRPTAGRVLFLGEDLIAVLATRRAAFRRTAQLPRFLVTDEPVSMLDVSVRAGILKLLRSFARDLGVAILYISHDLSTMKHISDRIAVMYLGRIVELAPAPVVVSHPQHPYTQALMASVPIPDPSRRRVPPQIQGSIPSPIGARPGCAFAARCPHVMDLCRGTEPALRPVGDGHVAACHLHDSAAEGALIS